MKGAVDGFERALPLIRSRRSTPCSEPEDQRRLPDLARPVDGAAHHPVDRGDRAAGQIVRSLVHGLAAQDLPARGAAAAHEGDGGRLNDPGHEGRPALQVGQCAYKVVVLVARRQHLVGKLRERGVLGNDRRRARAVVRDIHKPRPEGVEIQGGRFIDKEIEIRIGIVDHLADIVIPSRYDPRGKRSACIREPHPFAGCPEVLRIVGVYRIGPSADGRRVVDCDRRDGVRAQIDVQAGLLLGIQFHPEQ